MTKSKKILLSFLIVIGLLIIVAIAWFNTYHYFSPLYNPCNKQLHKGMNYDEAKNIMSPYFNNPNFSSSDSMYQSGSKRIMQFSDKNGIFCFIEFKKNTITEILFGREG